ncbi:MAG TPA: hypothetical protein VMG10_36070 [Gemmataceae bacterium]|nr:hypothetical protein [Gemmataceae bacterium]
MEPTASTPAKGLFVAVGHHGLRMTSRDGADWKHLQLGKQGEVYRAVRFGNERFVAVGTYGGSNIFAASTDGAKWKTALRDGKYVKYVRGLGFGDSRFVGVGGDPGSVGNAQPFVVTSKDGLQWTDYTSISGKKILRRLAFGDGRFVGVGDLGRRAASRDGLKWEDAPGVRAIDTLIDVAFGKGVFVGVGLHGLRMTSSDGLKWTHRQLGEEGEHLNAVVWTGERFVAVGAGATYLSDDGSSWRREANQDAPQAVGYGGGVFVGATWKGRLLRSTDAIRWEQVYRGEHHVEAFAWSAV